MGNLASKVKQLTKDSFFYGLGGAITNLISFFKAPILTRIFVPGDYGYMDFISTTFAFFLVIAGLNMISGLYRFYYEMKNEDEKRNLLVTGFYFTVFTTIVIFSSLQLLKPVIIDYIVKNSGQGRNNELFVQLVIFRTPFYLLQSFFLSILRLQRKARLFFYINIGEALLNFLLTITLVVFFKQHLFGVFFSNLFTVVLGSLFVLFLLRKEISGKFSMSLFRKMMRVALPSYPTVIINLAFAKMSNLFIYEYSNEFKLGLYSIAIKVASVINLIGYAYRSAFVPFSMEIMHQSDHKKDYNALFRIAVIFFSVSAFMVSIFSKPIFMVFAPPSYYEAIRYIPFILFAIAFDFSHFSLVTGISISKKTEYATYAQIISLVIGVLLNYYMIKHFSAFGAAIVSLPVYMSKYYFIYLFSQKLYKIDYDFKVDRLFFTLYAISVIFSLLIVKLDLFISLSLSIVITLVVLYLLFFLFLSSKEKLIVLHVLNKFINGVKERF